MKIKNLTIRRSHGRFIDMTVAKNHNFYVQNQLVHNCNTSAKNVVIVGNTRGLEPIDELDIIQAAGRAGRFGKAPDGHVYFVCDSVTAWPQRISNPRNVNSTLLDEDVLSFHICAEIRNKVITDIASLHDWYNRTLSVIQCPLSDEMVENVIKKLCMWNAVKMDDDGQLTCTALGLVAATLYYHPKDVYHWSQCLAYIGFNELWTNEYALAYMLAYPTARLPYVARKDEIRVLEAVEKLRPFWRGAIMQSTLYADMVDLLKGEKPSPAARQIQYDIDRIVGALSWIGNIGKVMNLQLVNLLPYQVKYGVPGEVAVLCQIDKVGGARAKKLFDSGITTINKVASSASTVRQLFGDAVGNAIVTSAKELLTKVA